MVMKQTQTKLFDFSDVGLDFCAGSKNLFPDRFKKMLANGYNPQTASSASITGNQVTLTYGVTHGYVADRVLQVTAAGGYNKEVYIDSVTSSTVTFTDATATGLTGLISTKVASLGWELVYELANIHVYKMKHIDDTVRYTRLCFQNNSSHRNAIAICIGKSFDAVTGFIDDPNALQSTRNVMSPAAGSLPKWDFGYFAAPGYNNYTYSAGYGDYGKACIVGSSYHLALFSNTYYRQQFNAILPVSTFDYDVLQYPLILGTVFSGATSSEGQFLSTLDLNGYGAAFIGNTRCRFDITNSVSNNVLSTPLKATASVLPSIVDGFNTTTTINLPIYDHATSQFFGYCLGIYIAMYANNATAPNLTKENLPQIMTDIDFGAKVIVHDGAGYGGKNNAVYVVMPIEEIKIA